MKFNNNLKPIKKKCNRRRQLTELEIATLMEPLSLRRKEIVNPSLSDLAKPLKIQNDKGRIRKSNLRKNNID